MKTITTSTKVTKTRDSSGTSDVEETTTVVHEEFPTEADIAYTKSLMPK